MFGVQMSERLYVAAKVAEAINDMLDKGEVVTDAEALNLHPIYESAKHGGAGAPIYAYQAGDETILVCLCADGNVTCKRACW